MNMKTQKITRTLHTDALVVGGGTAGFVAAIAVARNGARAILVEQHDYLGGTMSGAMVMMIRSMRHMQGPGTGETRRLVQTGYESSYDHEQVVYSIAQEFVDRMVEAGAAWGAKGKATARQMFDPEIAKWVIEQMTLEAGVDVWLYSHATDVLLSDNRVMGVVVENLQERVEINAKVTIDATGDGDISVAAGAAFEKGDPDEGRCQPLSLYFALAGVDLDATLRYLRENPKEIGEQYVSTLCRLREEGKPITFALIKSRVKEAVERGEYPIPYGIENVNPEAVHCLARPIFRNGAFRYDITYHNMDMAYNVDATNRSELTEATIGMRDVAVKMAAFYRKYIPGYEKAYLAYTAQFVGIRDSRRIVCDYTLTRDDVLSGRKFDDGIGRYGSIVDVHDREGKEETLLKEVGGKGWFHIPYRIVLPRGIENLLVAGRCVSADFIAQGCTRSQAACMLTGQATGTAAALAIKKGIEPRAIDIRELQSVLASQNQII